MTRRLLIPLAFGLIGAAVLISLGMWQLERLTWKQGVLAEIDARMTAAPVAVPQDATEDAHQFMPVTATGTIAADQIHVLASVKGFGPGFRIIAALDLADGRRILLDRGFVVPKAKNAARPAVAATITGNLLWPDEMNSNTPPHDIEDNHWFARDIPAMAAHLGAEPVMLVQRTSTEDNLVTTPFPVDSAGIPNNHLEYVLTWFGLAIVWLVMTGYFLWRSRQRPEKGTN